MLNVSLAALSLTALFGFIFGLRYLLCSSFMPYHAQVVGKAWEQIEPRVQAIILGMLRIIGGGFLSFAVTLSWLTYALVQGARWAPWAIFSIAAVALLPSLYVAIKLRSVEPNANTPVRPVALAILLVAVGAALALLA
jgi:hypothetical protein